MKKTMKKKTELFVDKNVHYVLSIARIIRSGRLARVSRNVRRFIESDVLVHSLLVLIHVYTLYTGRQSMLELLGRGQVIRLFAPSEPKTVDPVSNRITDFTRRRIGSSEPISAHVAVRVHRNSQRMLTCTAKTVPRTLVEPSELSGSRSNFKSVLPCVVVSQVSEACSGNSNGWPKECLVQFLKLNCFKIDKQGS